MLGVATIGAGAGTEAMMSNRSEPPFEDAVGWNMDCGSRWANEARAHERLAEGLRPGLASSRR